MIRYIKSSFCFSYWVIGAGFLKRPSSDGFGTGSNDIRLPKSICCAIGNLSKTYIKRIKFKMNK
jgi:hypothetical protein